MRLRHRLRQPCRREWHEIIASRCALCHGMEGQSASAVYPRLAAQHPDYLVKQLKDFRDGRRKSETMADMAKGFPTRTLPAWRLVFFGQDGRRPAAG
jgi:cytochrome c553